MREFIGDDEMSDDEIDKLQHAADPQTRRLARDAIRARVEAATLRSRLGAVADGAAAAADQIEAMGGAGAVASAAVLRHMVDELRDLPDAASSSTRAALAATATVATGPRGLA